MANELRTIRTFYNREQSRMYYPPQLCIIQDDAYAAELLRKGAVERVSIRPGTPIESPKQSIPVSGFASEAIETKQITPKRNAKRK